MKKIGLFFVLTACVNVLANSQLLSWSPDFIQENTASTEITMDANYGNKGLFGYATTTDVYVHIGVITNKSTSSSNWQYVRNFGVPSNLLFSTTVPQLNCASLGANKWKFTISGNIRNFFGISNSPDTIIQKIAILFRSGNGNTVQRNADGSDMYVPVYDNGLYARVNEPFRTPFYNLGTETISKIVGDNINITAKTSQAADLKIYFNGAAITTASSATSATANPQITANGIQEIVAEATVGATKHSDTVKFLVAPPVNVAALPAGVQDGINYETDATAVTLVVHAPGKNRIAVIGDFNNWTETVAHQMNKTPDGNKFWLRITGLTSGQEYGFQYVIDNTIKTGDAYAEKVLDPWNDQYIPTTSYPSLKPYPTGKTSGIVSVLQTNKPAYTWVNPSFARPNKKNLLIYEMLVRDFTDAKTFTAIKDTLAYLKKLGINCLQLMPVMEFDGNNSWGYNPSYFLAVDKFYGTETAFKQLVDACHGQGIAVVLDIAMNHATGSNPLAAMYWDAANNKPSSTNPWFNADAKHPFNVFNDFNHESDATKYYTSRVIRHWLTNFKIDGFRWDLSKGFTQLNSGSNVGLWGNYDASRVTIWKRYYDSMQAVSAGSYCILEHFAENSEEIALSDYGMLLWGNANYFYRNAVSSSTVNSSDLSSISHLTRGWNQPHLVGYAESHDEERLVYDALANGRSSGPYNIKDTATALKRAEMAAAFLALVPGPKMIWQYGELGFHFSINRCTNGTIDNNCRLAEKPVFWYAKNNASRLGVYNVYSKLFSLRTNPSYNAAFTSNTGGFTNASTVIKQFAINDPSLRVVVAGNFDVNSIVASVSFPTNGVWYDVFRNTYRTISGNSESIAFQPGDYYVFADKNVNNIPTSIFNPGYNLANFNVSIYPNPVSLQSNVKYELPESGKVSISMMDISGKILGAVNLGYKNKGLQSIELKNIINNIKKLDKGTYLIQVDVNGRKQTQKCIVI